MLRAHPLAELFHHSADVVAPCPAAALERAQLQRAEFRGGQPLADPPVANLGQFHGRAAKVADQAVGAGPAQQHALRRESGLFLAVDDPDAQARLLQHLFPEGRAVFGVAHRGSRHGGQAGQAHALRQKLEPFQRGQGAHAAFGIQSAGFRQPGAKGAHDLFVVEIGGRAGGAIEDNQTHRVRADIDNADFRQRAGAGIIEQGAPEGTAFRYVSIRLRGHGSPGFAW